MDFDQTWYILSPYENLEPYWFSGSPGQIFTIWHPCEHSRINILQWILTKLGTDLVLKRIWNITDFQGHRSKVKSPGQIFTMWHPCEHSRINILQWILTKLGTYLALKRIWNPIDFQGHRSKVKVIGSNFYRVTSLWTLESTSFNGFSPNLVHT